MTRRRTLPKWVSSYRDRHGKVRLRFRRRGFAEYQFQNVAYSDGFNAEYERCCDGTNAPAIEPGADRVTPGTINDVVSRYYRSTLFLDVGESTKATYRGIIERFRAEHGTKMVAHLERKHVAAIIAAKHNTPAAARNLRRMIRMLMRFAVSEGMRATDPTINVPVPAGNSRGFHTWTDAEIAKYRAHHKIGTRERLALELLLCLAQRRSDAHRIGPANIVDGRMVFVPWKTRRKSPEPIAVRIGRDLAEALAHVPAEASHFLLTSFGKPFTVAGFGNWFREACNDAGLPHCTAHGLRKAKARQLAERGRSTKEIMAVGGWKTLKSVQPYVDAADQRHLADRALADEEMSNPAPRLDKTDGQPPETTGEN